MELPTSVFVTGSTGLLGINTVELLLAKGYQVGALARDPEKAARVLPVSDRLEIIVGDLENPDAWLPSISKFQVIIHTAAYFREYFGRGDHAVKLKALNVDLPVRLTKFAMSKGVERVIIVSSTGAISPPNPEHAATEDDPAEGQVPHNGYQQSKVMMEKALSKLTVPTGQLVMVRPGWMFGPNDHAPTNAAQLVLDMRGKRKFQFMDGPPFGIVDARDVAAGLVALVSHPNPKLVYNLAGNNLSPLAAIQTLAAVEGKTKIQAVPLGVAKVLSRTLEVFTRPLGKRNPLPYEGIEVLSTNFKVDSSRAEKELGVHFRPFEDTARDTVAFVNQAF